MERLSNDNQEWLEWTSSFLRNGNITNINGVWDTSLDPTIHFIIRGYYFDPRGVLELKTDLMHVSLLFSSDNLGFRCVSN